jgi:murein DD-endopeptidase MepM/ murein hydrolase activator NlpD
MRKRKKLSRRTVVRSFGAATLATGGGLPGTTTRAQGSPPAFSYPMGLAGRLLGDGLLIRHGYACENTWFFPGYWHTGEDWYLPEGDTAGLPVFAAAAGEVVFAGSEYPGRVVIIQHEEDLFSMYGHLDYALAIAGGQRVARGQMIGTVLARTDGRAPSHLHFEIRTFLTTPEVNGDAPRYGFNCGYECPPGPGYWPIDAPEHPSAMGWRNPTHVINHRAWDGRLPDDAEAIVSDAAPEAAPLWSAAAGGGEVVDEVRLTPGDRFPLLAIDAGAEDTTGTSAEAYRLWYHVGLPDGNAAWMQAAVPSTNDTGSDGRPSSVRFDLLLDQRPEG